jgi:uncharacterized cupredoxin-like copper-binding protein
MLIKVESTGGSPAGEREGAHPRSASKTEGTMKQALIAFIVLLLGAGSAIAAGDLSRNNPIEIKIHLGTIGAKMYMRPDHVDLETGKAYKLTLINDDKQTHEFSSGGLMERVFTRKVEVMGPDGKTIAEIKGAIREIELAPKGVAEWFIVPVQDGKDIEMVCEIEGHKQAGMRGTVTIK